MWEQFQMPPLLLIPLSPSGGDHLCSRMQAAEAPLGDLIPCHFQQVLPETGRQRIFSFLKENAPRHFHS